MRLHKNKQRFSITVRKFVHGPYHVRVSCRQNYIYMSAINIKSIKSNQCGFIYVTSKLTKSQFSVIHTRQTNKNNGKLKHKTVEQYRIREGS